MSLGRIVTQWEDIIGPKMAARAQPVKIYTRRPKSKRDKPQVTLEIAASSADCAQLQMQKDVILQRINLLFGDSWITDIKFLHVAPDVKLSKKPSKPKNLDGAQSGMLEEWLEKIADPDIKERLRQMGSALLGKETKTKDH